RADQELEQRRGERLVAIQTDEIRRERALDRGEARALALLETERAHHAAAAQSLLHEADQRAGLRERAARRVAQAPRQHEHEARREREDDAHAERELRIDRDQQSELEEELDRLVQHLAEDLLQRESDLVEVGREQREQFARRGFGRGAAQHRLVRLARDLLG